MTQDDLFVSMIGAALDGHGGCECYIARALPTTEADRHHAIDTCIAVRHEEPRCLLVAVS